MTKKQTEIAGTERKKLSKIEAQAEMVRELTGERLKVHAREIEERGKLMAMLRLAEKNGELTVDRTMADNNVIPVYRYTDGDGTARVIKHGFAEKVSVVQDRVSDG